MAIFIIIIFCIGFAFIIIHSVFSTNKTHTFQNPSSPSGVKHDFEMSSRDAEDWNRLFEKHDDPGRLKEKEQGTDYITLIIFLVTVWSVATMFYQSWVCPELTQMEVLKNIHNSFILNWIDCPQKLDIPL